MAESTANAHRDVTDLKTNPSQCWLPENGAFLGPQNRPLKVFFSYCGDFLSFFEVQKAHF